MGLHVIKSKGFMGFDHVTDSSYPHKSQRMISFSLINSFRDFVHV